MTTRYGGPLTEITCVRGESFVVSSHDGDVIPGTDHGFFVRDTRFLCGLEVFVDGAHPSPLNAGVTAPGRASFHSYLRRSASHEVDPTLLMVRRRWVDGGLREEFTIDNRGTTEVEIGLEVRLASDLATVFDVKHGAARPALTARVRDGAVSFGDDGERVEVVAHPPATLTDGVVGWQLRIPASGSQRVALEFAATDRYGTDLAPSEDGDLETAAARPAAGPGHGTFTCSESRVTRLLNRSLEDLQSLTVSDPADPRDRFCAAGSPWFLTLFGRDSLWTAFATTPYDLALAGGTLRTLARRQGQRHDLDREEAPGKILHEIRRGALGHEGAFPATYYGSIDSTPLFVVLLSEAWRWGLPEEQVRPLLPHLEAALAWMRDDGDPDGDGFLEYLRPGDRGLVNQGWKDSRDGVQHRDGRLARPPIALVEVQAYAFDAAMRGAELLDHFDRPDGDGWRAWAARLQRRFRDHFWVHDEEGPYLAIALDADGQPVDAVTSNMGHVLVTDLLDEAERAAVARRLASPAMDSGWGLRTMAAGSAGYNPLGYHTGSVWPHDTAIAVWGLARSGQRDAAVSLLEGLVRAAPHVRFRLPELLGGLPRRRGGYPVPYPVACRPQAWSAAAAPLLIRACLGADAHLPEGRLTLSPLWPPPFRHLEVRGFPIAGGELDVVVDAVRGVSVDRRDTDLEVTIRGPR